MNKVELIAAVAAKAELSKKDAEKAIAAVVASIEEALVKGDKVQLIGFGTFEVKARGEKKGHNPHTGEQIVIPASKRPAFSASKVMKDRVNG